jgi:hypothetical protein
MVQHARHTAAGELSGRRLRFVLRQPPQPGTRPLQVLELLDDVKHGRRTALAAGTRKHGSPSNQVPPPPSLCHHFLHHSLPLWTSPAWHIPCTASSSATAAQCLLGTAAAIAEEPACVDGRQRLAQSQEAKHCANTYYWSLTCPAHCACACSRRCLLEKWGCHIRLCRLPLTSQCRR